MGANPSFGIDLLRYGFLGEDPIQPGPYYVALHTAQPSWAGSNEVSGGGYQRLQVQFVVDGTELKNSADMEYENMPAVTVTHVSLFRQSSGGAPVWRGALTTPQQVVAGSTCRIKAGDLSVSLGDS